MGSLVIEYTWVSGPVPKPLVCVFTPLHWIESHLAYVGFIKAIRRYGGGCCDSALPSSLQSGINV